MRKKTVDLDTSVMIAGRYLNLVGTLTELNLCGSLLKCLFAIVIFSTYFI